MSKAADRKRWWGPKNRTSRKSLMRAYREMGYVKQKETDVMGSILMVHPTCLTSIYILPEGMSYMRKQDNG